MTCSLSLIEWCIVIRNLVRMQHRVPVETVIGDTKSLKPNFPGCKQYKWMCWLES